MSTFRLKTKITLGVLFLYIMLLVVSILGYYYLNRLNEKAKFILKDNYESLEYSKNMLVALEDLPAHRAAAMQTFSVNLRKQQANVTERGEKDATEAVARIFELFKKDSTIEIGAIKKNIYTIMDLNMAAIVGKNERVKKTADNALLYIAIISGLCFVLGFTFVYNFPGYIANPIDALTQGIKDIANKQYGKRLYFKSGDEFGDLAAAFNTMAQRLDEYEHSNLARIVFEKQRAEAVISSLKDATIGFDVNNVILFANTPALQLLNIPEKDLIGQPAEEIAKRNDLLRFLVNTKENAPLKIVVDGKECFFTRETTDIRHEEKRIGYVVILRNITTFKEQDIAKTHFIATISHELKTPLAASDFSIKLLEDERTGVLSTEQKELLDSLKQDNRRMIKIVSELLDLSQVESGNIQLQPQPVTAMNIVQYAMDTVQKQAAQREKEEELVFRGLQYVHAIGLFQRKFANAYPPNIDVLVDQRFLRKKFKDPITNDDFVPILAGQGVPGSPQAPGGQRGIGGPGGSSTPGGQNQPASSTQPGGGRAGGPPISAGSTGQTSGGIQGVTSKSKDQSIRLYNGRGHYNEWAFVYIQQQQAGGGAAGTAAPGPGGQRGQPGQNQPPGPFPGGNQPGRGGRGGTPGAPNFPGRGNNGGLGTFGGGGVTPVQPPSPPRGRF